MGEMQLSEGRYATPEIGTCDSDRAYPESTLIVQGGRMGLDSVLFGRRVFYDELIADPRAVHFIETFSSYYLHLLDVRQLSAPEGFATREGVGRMDRLTTLGEGALLLGKIGGTLEQHVQNQSSDSNVTLGSHRVGDHLVGDYVAEGTRDNDIWDFTARSGFAAHLHQQGLLDEHGFLVGSPMRYQDMANPNQPRRFDTVEAPRPDGNIDRIPFTLIEGAYLVPPADIVEAVGHIHRVEVSGSDGGTEERLAFSDIDAARLTHTLAVRHANEHWGDSGHNAAMELLSVVDRHRLTEGVYHPIDTARRDEVGWYNDPDLDDFSLAMYAVTQRVSTELREAQLPVQYGEIEYGGTPLPAGVSVQQVTELAGPSVRVERNGRYSSTGTLSVHSPQHKRRPAIDAWVTSRSGMQRLSTLDPSVKGYEERLSRYHAHSEVRFTLPWDMLGQVQKGIQSVERIWHILSRDTASHPLNRPPMPQAVMTKQINAARETVRSTALWPLRDLHEVKPPSVIRLSQLKTDSQAGPEIADVG